MLKHACGCFGRARSYQSLVATASSSQLQIARVPPRRCSQVGCQAYPARLGRRFSTAPSPEHVVPQQATSSFDARSRFAFPESAPSWYAGHMHRAARSLPALLRQAERETGKRPLIVEVRDARLCLTSINPFFERLLNESDKSRSRSKGKGKQRAVEGEGHKGAGMTRLIVYTKADLIDKRYHQAIKKSLRKHAPNSGEEIFFIDTRNDGDVRRIYTWVNAQAKRLASEAAFSSSVGGRHPRGLSGAFRHTPTPSSGVRLVILGMPNVGKSSLLNALRRVGIRGKKAVGTAPEPGFTRKLTGTVRITHKAPSGGDLEPRTEKDKDKATAADESAVYVYDTPGIMVPYLGRGEEGIERGFKMAATAGIKSNLFDTLQVADYLLFRMNKEYLAKCRIGELEGAGADTVAAYLTDLQLYTLSSSSPTPTKEPLGPTDDIPSYLTALAARAPGTMRKGGEFDLDSAAQFFVQRWREGKFGSAELDLGVWERAADAIEAGAKAGAEQAIEDAVDEAVRMHFTRMGSVPHGEVQQAEGDGEDSNGIESSDSSASAPSPGHPPERVERVEESKNQARKRLKKEAMAKRTRQLLADGVKIAPERLRKVGIL